LVAQYKRKQYKPLHIASPDMAFGYIGTGLII